MERTMLKFERYAIEIRIIDFRRTIKKYDFILQVELLELSLTSVDKSDFCIVVDAPKTVYVYFGGTAVERLRNAAEDYARALLSKKEADAKRIEIDQREYCREWLYLFSPTLEHFLS